MDYEEIIKRNADYESEEQTYNRLQKKYEELEDKKVNLEKEIENINKKRKEAEEDIKEIASYLSTGKKFGIVRGTMLNETNLRKQLKKAIEDSSNPKEQIEKVEKEIEEVSKLIDRIAEICNNNIKELESNIEKYMVPVNRKERYNRENERKAKELNDRIALLKIELAQVDYYINEGVYSKTDLNRKKELEKEIKEIETELNELNHGMGPSPELGKLNAAQEQIEKYNELIDRCNSTNKKNIKKNPSEERLMTPEEIFADFEETKLSDEEILKPFEPEKLIFEEKPRKFITKVDIADKLEITDELLKKIEQYVVLTGNAKEQDIEKAFKISNEEASLALEKLEENKVVSRKKENGIREVLKSADEYLNENYEVKAGVQEENSSFDDIFKEETSKEENKMKEWIKKQREAQSIDEKVNEFNNNQKNDAKELIKEYVKDKEKVSEMDIKMKFNIPTVTMTQILKELEQEGILGKNNEGEREVIANSKKNEPIEAEVLESEIIDETVNIKEPTSEDKTQEELKELVEQYIKDRKDTDYKNVINYLENKASLEGYNEEEILKIEENILEQLQKEKKIEIGFGRIKYLEKDNKLDEQTEEKEVQKKLEDYTNEQLIDEIKAKAQKVPEDALTEQDYLNMSYGEYHTTNGTVYFILKDKKKNIEDLIKGETSYILLSDSREEVLNFLKEHKKDKSKKIVRKVKRITTSVKMNELKLKALAFFAKQGFFVETVEPEKPIVCPNCGVHNFEDANLCERCGAVLLNIESEKSNGRTR